MKKIVGDGFPEVPKVDLQRIYYSRKRSRSMKKQYLDSGKIVGTHGIKGEVRIEPWCDSPEFLCAFKKLYLDEKGQTFIEVKSRPHKNITLAKIKGVDTIEAAEKLRGKIIYINRDDITLDEGVNFVQDLIGLEVKDAENGTVYGKITDVLHTGANDVYEITDSNNKKYLAPVIDEVVEEINVDGGFVLIRPMKGIFDDED